MSLARGVILLLSAALAAFGLAGGCRKRSAPPATRPAAAASRGGTRAPGPAPVQTVEPIDEQDQARQRQAARRRASEYARREQQRLRAELDKLNRAMKDPKTHVTRGRKALAQKDFPAAVESFYRALGLDPTHPAALRGLAVALVGAQRYEEAADLYEMIVGLDPDSHDALFDLAVVQSRLLRFGRAEQSYRRLLADEGVDEATRVKACYNLATLCQAQGKLGDARDAWREVLRRAPHLAGAHSKLGEVLLDLDDPAGAMAAYAEAAKLRPMEVGAWLNLAAASRAAGSYGRAVVAIQRAEKLAPANALVFRRKGELMIELHRATSERKFVVEAVAAWRKSLRLDPTQQDVRDLLATYEAALKETPADGRPAGPPAGADTRSMP